MADPPENSSPDRPLSGKTVLLTRAEHQNAELAAKLERLGAETIAHPMIRIEPVDSEQVQDRLGQLSDFSILAVLSPNGAVALTRLVKELPADIPVVAIGQGTRRALMEQSIHVSACPDKANSQSLGEALAKLASDLNSSLPLLIVRADRGSTELAEALQMAELPFEELAIYRSVDVERPDPDVLESLKDGKIDWITLTSSAIARNVARLFGSELTDTQISLVSISPTTTAAAQSCGLSVAATSAQASLDGIVEAILFAERGK